MGRKSAAGTVALVGALTVFASLLVGAQAGAAPGRSPEPSPQAAKPIDPGARFGFDLPDKVPAAEYAEDRLLVRFTSSSSGQERDQALARQGLRRGGSVGRTGFIVAHTQGKRPEQAQRGLRGEKAVEAAELDYVRTTFDQSTQTHDKYSWNMSQYEPTQVGPAWEITTGAATRVIAVVDTGVRASHSELAGRVLAGRDFAYSDSNAADDNGHGTAVASIAAGNRANNGGIPGVAGTSKILPVKVLDRYGEGYDSDIASGITWAADQSADIINLSLGGLQHNSALSSAVAHARSKGSLVVAAAGNFGAGNTVYPAADPGVVAVGATGHRGELAHFSSFGDHLDVAAPGVELWGANYTGDQAYLQASGTSFSAPFVSGAAALVMTRYPTWSADQVASRLRTTAADVGPPGMDRYYGSGVVDVLSALGEWVPNPRPPVVDEGYGADDHPAGAVTLQLGATQSLGSADDVAWYRWTANADRLDFAVNPDGPPSDQRDGRGLDPVVVVTDSSLRVLGYADAQNVYGTETVGLPVTSGQTYYVAVYNYNGSGGNYQLQSAGGGSITSASGQVWVRDVSPQPRAASLGATTPFQVTFVRDLDSASVTESSVRLVDGVTGATAPATRGYDSVRRVLTVQPSGKLLPNRPYRLDVSGVKDTSGNSLVGFQVLVATGDIGRGFTPREPVRVLDTRSGLGAPQARLGAGQYIDLQITGTSELPYPAEAVVVNVTAVKPTKATYVSVIPSPSGAGQPPTTSSLNVAAGEVRANQVTVSVGAGGKVRLYNYAGEIDLVVDLGGWYLESSGDGFEPVAPARLLDTREGIGASRARVGANKFVDVRVHGRGGVPSHASAVVVNVTGVKPTRGTYLKVTPAPLFSNVQTEISHLNLKAGEVVPNLVTVPIGRDGKVRLRNFDGEIHLVGDVVGYFSPHGRAAFRMINPVRLLDTRDGTGVPEGTIGAGDHRDLDVVAGLGDSGIRAVVFNVTGIRPTASTYLTAFPTPAGDVRPTTSTLNLVANEIRPNAATVPVGHLGRARFYNYAGEAHLAADAVGYYRATPYSP